ncbi:MAG: U32 family peptidase [Prevotellaceae bacterium]|jgi:putative protease|nr:U32 family peptidase [Prevotellaceae bacterium]
MRKIELLAPARDRESGEAAINHGADAVYIGGNKFGAREAAGNSFADIELLCGYAHKYFAKVYLTLNTILYDNELEQAREMVVRAFNIGCDAVIVQDMALLEMDLPPIPLFASTQTDNCTLEKIKFLQDIGFSRVILARELSLKQIAEIGKATSIELESFVHGSLCVSYSGRCYLSEVLSGRSANRGCCAQLCRLPFDLYDAQGVKIASDKHLLSLKDLNMSDYLEDLMLAGVTSFKIEGRLKDISYVKNITAFYRKRIDALLDKSDSYRKASSGKVNLFFEPDAERSFSRGFTAYFAKGRKRGLNAGTAKSTGKFCGTVISVAKRSFTIDNAASLANGDGVCFFDSSGKLLGTRVNSANGNAITPLSMEGISKGTKIFRNSDRLFDKQLAAKSAVRKIHADVSIAISGNDILISAKDEDSVSVEISIPHSAEKAVDRDRMRTTIIEQFGKTGETVFDFQTDCADCEYFFPVSAINAWRRQLIRILETERQNQYRRKESQIVRSGIPYIMDEIDFTANVSNSLAERFYQRHRVRKIAKAVETGTVPTSLMFNKYCIKFELGLCPVKQNAPNSGDLFLTCSNKKLKLHFDCKKCEMIIVKNIEDA